MNDTTAQPEAPDEERAEDVAPEPEGYDWRSLIALALLVAAIGCVVTFWWTTRRGTVNIASDPDRATVIFDGYYEGETPLKLVGVRPGPHHVKLIRSGRRPWAAVIDVGGGPMDVRASMTSRFAPPVEVTATPTGARVYADGRYCGTTPVEIADLEPGSHDFLVSSPEYSDWRETVRIPVDESVKVTARLNHKMVDYYKAAIRAEPWNLPNYAELLHLQIILGDMDGAAETLRAGLLVQTDPRQRERNGHRAQNDFIQRVKRIHAGQFDLGGSEKLTAARNMIEATFEDMIAEIERIPPDQRTTRQSERLNYYKRHLDAPWYGVRWNAANNRIP